MREDFLHYLWRMKRFDLQDLTTTTGETIQIQHTGELNQNAGPDFLEARIRIGNTLWAGNVEMHVKASEWHRHGHQSDAAYGSVILHVVLEEDQPIYRPSGEPIPCLELQGRIPSGLSDKYQQLIHNEQWIACQAHFPYIKDITHQLWLDRLLIERLEHKTEYIARRLAANGNDWEETGYQMLARSFGTKVNADAFEQLARSIPLLTLLKHKDQLLKVEALLFGQSGLLEKEFTDDYPRQLQKEYRFLQRKYDLQPIAATNWKFMRLRPANFPSIRIAQLAILIFQTQHLFSKLLAAKNVGEISYMFSLKLSSYWHTHYVFDKPSGKRHKSLGRNTIELIIINTIAPLLFLYGMRRGEQRYKDKALQLLEELPPEKNQIIRKWTALGITPRNACQTQALLHLKNTFCVPKRCLSCAIGDAILNASA